MEVQFLSKSLQLFSNHCNDFDKIQPQIKIPNGKYAVFLDAQA